MRSLPCMQEAEARQIECISLWFKNIQIQSVPSVGARERAGGRSG